ncbi:hypothetical protein [Pseudoxanthomonas sacheonensis]|uniref:Uncharacterized protein n=1 Tax=Pseudoxanthomonas sacheonensis TaxID=443615 RepID=A0ABU1RUP5_9GAMM|nr:hypothetical protein [Pseudoxanthomonas sacheonensis]MDR6842307.1 hypothetical protein [Pseudoxanthomonas sacheonensis]
MVNVQTLHRRAARVLPEVIKTSGVLLEDAGQNELTAMLFPLRRKSTGAVLFRLSVEMINEMASDPLAYLREATQAREGLGRRCDPFVYREWRVAHIPGSWLAMVCQSCTEPRAASVWAYFTTKTDGKALVVVIPFECVAAYVWCD